MDEVGPINTNVALVLLGNIGDTSCDIPPCIIDEIENKLGMYLRSLRINFKTVSAFFNCIAQAQLYTFWINTELFCTKLI